MFFYERQRVMSKIKSNRLQIFENERIKTNSFYEPQNIENMGSRSRNYSNFHVKNTKKEVPCPKKAANPPRQVSRKCPKCPFSCSTSNGMMRKALGRLLMVPDSHRQMGPHNEAIVLPQVFVIVIIVTVINCHHVPRQIILRGMLEVGLNLNILR